MTRFTINGEGRAVDVDGGTPLLWLIRDELQLTGVMRTRLGGESDPGVAS